MKHRQYKSFVILRGLFACLIALIMAMYVSGGIAADPSPSVPCQPSAEDPRIATLHKPKLAADIPEIGIAAFKGDVSSLRRLISSGANLESSGEDKRRPLLLAVAGGQMEAVSILLKAGANVDASDRYGCTALHWAASKAQDKMALLLLSYHPELNLQNEAGESPLIVAAEIGSKTIARALINAGADRDLVDEDGRSAKAWAKINNHADIIALLERSSG